MNRQEFDQMVNDNFIDFGWDKPAPEELDRAFSEGLCAADATRVIMKRRTAANRKKTCFIIIKSSRIGSTWPYSGQTCADANVPDGKVYESYIEAVFDAKKLTEWNPVGFVVRQVSLETLRTK